MPPAQLAQNAGDSLIETKIYASPTQCSDGPWDKADQMKDTSSTGPATRLPTDVPGERCSSQDASSSIAIQDVIALTEVQHQEEDDSENVERDTNSRDAFRSSHSESRTPRRPSHASSQRSTRQASGVQLGDEFIAMLSEDDDCVSDVLARDVPPVLEGESECKAFLTDTSERRKSSGPARTKRRRDSFRSHQALAKEKYFLAMEHLAKFEKLLI
mmetsp:Transcript_35668/g.106440  ORF Transcript_35668/g.106440 Transcript_35668/m.106440 type:complete len:215 (-) Transcript_35668:164-808(-)